MSYVKIINQIWIDLGGPQIPDKYKYYQESWITKHKDWKYILWNESMGDNLIKKYYPQYYNAFNNVKYPIMKIDILRYCIMYQYGGMYADIDYKCLNNFNEYLDKLDQYDIHLNEQPNEFYNFMVKCLQFINNFKT
jgi:mannosyltransferase OCH1-like enzyme